VYASVHAVAAVLTTAVLVLLQSAWEAWLGDPANQVHIQAFQGQHNVNREQQHKLESKVTLRDRALRCVI